MHSVTVGDCDRCKCSGELAAVDSVFGIHNNLVTGRSCMYLCNACYHKFMQLSSNFLLRIEDDWK